MGSYGWKELILKVLDDIACDRSLVQTKRYNSQGCQDDLVGKYMMRAPLQTSKELRHLTQQEGWHMVGMQTILYVTGVPTILIPPLEDSYLPSW